MDDLFAKLREGESLGRKSAKRARKAHGERLLNVSVASDQPGGTASSGTPSLVSPTSLDLDPAMAARGMLRQLKGDGVSLVHKNQHRLVAYN